MTTGPFVQAQDMPELEPLMLHRLAELDPESRSVQAYESLRLSQAPLSRC